MAGHSEWANIKHRKNKQDKKRAKLFSKLTRKITVAAREGGGDPEYNSDLRRAIQKAKDNDMPKENIEKAVKRGTGELEGVEYEEFVYEGYGPAGVALYIEIMSDNRNRTASEIRHILSESGGNLGQSGCVEWMFEKKGKIFINLEENNLDEDEIMLEAIEAGAEDVKVDENLVAIYTAPEDYDSVRSTLEKDKDLKISSSDLAMIPNNTVDVADKGDAKKTLNLMEELEDHEDVQEVYANFNIPDEILNKIENE